jgi:hypothetical protein
LTRKRLAGRSWSTADSEAILGSLAVKIGGGSKKSRKCPIFELWGQVLIHKFIFDINLSQIIRVISIELSRAPAG